MKPHGRIAACGAISSYNAAQSDSAGIKNWFEIISSRVQIRGFIVLDVVSEWGAYMNVSFLSFLLLSFAFVSLLFLRILRGLLPEGLFFRAILSCFFSISVVFVALQNCGEVNNSNADIT